MLMTTKLLYMLKNILWHMSIFGLFIMKMNSIIRQHML